MLAANVLTIVPALPLSCPALPCPALPCPALLLLGCPHTLLKKTEHQGKQLTIVPLMQKRLLQNAIKTLGTNFAYTVQESHAWKADTVSTVHSFIHLMVSLNNSLHAVLFWQSLYV